jgi:hypothetical protein
MGTSSGHRKILAIQSVGFVLLSLFIGGIFASIEVRQVNPGLWILVSFVVGVYVGATWYFSAPLRARALEGPSRWRSWMPKKLRLLALVFGLQAVLSFTAISIVREELAYVFVGFFFGFLALLFARLIWWVAGRTLNEGGWQW